MIDDLKKLFDLEKKYSQSNDIISTYNIFQKSLQNNFFKELNYTTLSIEDIFPIFAYTSGGPNNNNKIPGAINNSIRNGNIEPHIEFLINILNESLQKLPIYKGNSVFRMVDVDGLYIRDVTSQIIKFKNNINQTFLIDHFLSTSTECWGRGAMIWKIEIHPKNSNARDIVKYSAKMDSELEVLFCQGSKFQIISVDDKLSPPVVNLKEVLPTVKCALRYKNDLG